MTLSSEARPDEGRRYELRLQGHLDSRWSEWFLGFAVASDDDGTTTLTGYIADQAALHGLLRRFGDVGAVLLSVNQLDRNPEFTPTHQSSEEQ